MKKTNKPTLLQPKRFVYRISEETRAKLQRPFEMIEGFGCGHKPSASVWTSTTVQGYIKRMNRALNLFDIPKRDTEPVVADVGCGPWAGVFFVRRWAKMYAVDPSWSLYEQRGVINMLWAKDCKCISYIEDYAQTFKLPEPADFIFSINAINHAGNVIDSVANMMNNLGENGLLFLHVHLRPPEALSGGHPMALDKEVLDRAIAPYRHVKVEYMDSDLTRKNENQYRTLVATLAKQ